MNKHKHHVRFLWSLIFLVSSLFSAAQEAYDPFSDSLSQLLEEMKRLSVGQDERIRSYQEYAEIQQREMSDFIAQTDKISFMLFSQESNQTLQLAFVCSKAIAQCELFENQKIPIDNILSELQHEIVRYDKLIGTLKSLTEENNDASDTTKVLPPAPILTQNIAPNDTDSVSVVVVDSLAFAKVDTLSVSNTEEVEHNINEIISSITFNLTKEQIAERDNCLAIAERLRGSYVDVYNQIEKNRQSYNRYEQKVDELRSYANDRYSEIQTSIFHNNQPSFLSRLSNVGFFLKLCGQELKEKYFSGATLSSGHNGLIVLSFVGLIILWIVLSALLSNVVIRFAAPKRFKTPQFAAKRVYYVIAISMLIFSVFMILLKPFYSDYFISTATSILVQFSLLMMVIMFSLIFRYDAGNISHGLHLYLPVMLTGFFVIACRITFMSDTVLAMTLPLIFIIMTIWQYRRCVVSSGSVPMYDIIFGWMSFFLFLTSTITSWLGFSMLSVFIFSWWLTQLTCLHAIACLRDAMRMYEEKWLRQKFLQMIPDNEALRNASLQSYYKRKGDFLHVTWLADFVNMIVLPSMAILSLPFCLMWASQIFNLLDTCKSVMMSNFIDVDSLCQLSFFKIIAGTTLFFLFRFLAYVITSLYKQINRAKYLDESGGNSVLVCNLISFLTWGIYGLTMMVILNVSRSGLSIAVAGLATGIGFAMRDLLNNFFYGLSLMMGRLKVGEYIECDSVRGKVESINYQSTQIITMEGHVLSILNSTLFNKSFKNLTRTDAYELVKLPVGVAYGTDIPKVRNLVSTNVANLIKADADGNFNIDPKFGVSVNLVGFGDSSVDLSVNFKCRVARKGVISAKVNEVIYDTLNANDVEIPFPQTDVHIKNN